MRFFLLFLGAIIVVPVSAQFIDVPTFSEVYVSGRRLLNQGALEPRVRLQPDKPINRAEMVKIMATLHNPGGEFGVTGPCAGRFTDVAPTAWYAPFVCYGYEQGWVQGNPGGTFEPERNVNFAEASALVIRAFPDEKRPVRAAHIGEAWHGPLLSYVVERKWFPEMAPEYPLTRGDSVVLVANSFVKSDWGAYQAWHTVPYAPLPTKEFLVMSEIGYGEETFEGYARSESFEFRLGRVGLPSEETLGVGTDVFTCEQGRDEPHAVEFFPAEQTFVLDGRPFIFQVEAEPENEYSTVLDMRVYSGETREMVYRAKLDCFLRFWHVGITPLPGNELLITHSGGHEGIGTHNHYRAGTWTNVSQQLNQRLKERGDLPDFPGEAWFQKSLLPPLRVGVYGPYYRVEEMGYASDMSYDARVPGREEFRKVFWIDRRTLRVVKYDQVPRRTQY